MRKSQILGLLLSGAICVAYADTGTSPTSGADNNAPKVIMVKSAANSNSRRTSATTKTTKHSSVHKHKTRHKKTSAKSPHKKTTSAHKKPAHAKKAKSQ